MGKFGTIDQWGHENLVRLPDWRWRRATALVTAGKNASLKRDDRPTCDATRYLRSMRRSRSDRSARRIIRQQPALTVALSIYEHSDRRQRLELECRILARQRTAAIARTMRILPLVVETYKTMFFDVDERLSALPYIVQQVIQRPPIGPPSVEVLMKLSAYCHGPLAVTAWLDYLSHQSETHDLTSSEGRQREGIELFILAQQLPTADVTQKSLVRLGAEIFRKREINCGYRMAKERLANFVSKRLDGLTWGCGLEATVSVAADGHSNSVAPSFPSTTQPA